MTPGRPTPLPGKSSPSSSDSVPTINTIATAATTATTATTVTTVLPSVFSFPAYYSYPPFFSLQPTLSTRFAQLQKWSLLVQSYCRHHRLFRLALHAAVSSPLFYNATMRKGLGIGQVREVVDWMAGPDGERRAEWIGAVGERGSCWIWWRRPEEWAEVLTAWVDETGQKNTVLTLYELINGDVTASEEFHGMDQEILQRSLNILTKRGKAQVFGSEDQQGVKFF